MKLRSTLLVALALAACPQPADDSSKDTVVTTDTDDTDDTTADTDDTTTDTDDTTDDTTIDTDTTDSSSDTSLQVSYTGPTLADFIPCQATIDCPNGVGWRCVEQIPLSRATTTGVEFVSVASLWPGATLPGVCTEVCSLNSAPCDALSLDGTSVSQFTCQVVHVAETTYPRPAPPFPFDSELDAVGMAAGPVYAAVCRAPWGLDPLHLDQSCERCTDDRTCGTGHCWIPDVAVPSIPPAPGTCVQACITDSDCPTAFTCAEDDGSLYCMPDAGTCGPCADADGDGFGTGHCPRSGEDCDDADAGAWPRGAAAPLDDVLSDRCASHDLNCNGLDDETEVAGSDLFGLVHCLTCNDPCEFTTTDPNATLSCARDLGCQPLCDDGFEDCDGDYANGCETVLADAPPSWLDLDGDGVGCRDGQPDCEVRGVCPAGPADGFVENTGDCDDHNNEITANQHEHYADIDTDGFFAATNPPTFGCEPAAGFILATDVVGVLEVDCDDDNIDVFPGATEECNGVDDDCDDVADNHIGSAVTGAVSFVEDGDGDGYAPSNFNTEFFCDGSSPDGFVRNPLSGTDCSDDAPEIHPGAVELCSTIDENCDCPAGAALDHDCRIAGADPANLSRVHGDSCAYGSNLQGMCGEGTWVCGGNTMTCEPDNDQTRYPERFDNPFTPGDDDCDGSVNEASDVLFVAASAAGAGRNNGGSPAGTGTMGNPVDTLSGALRLARGRSYTTTILMEGTSLLSPEEIRLEDADDVLVIGGYGYDPDVGSGTFYDRQPTATSTLVRTYTASASRTPQQVGALYVGLRADAVFENIVLNFQTQIALRHGPVFFGIRVVDANSFALRNATIGMPSSIHGVPGVTASALTLEPNVAGYTVGEDTCTEQSIDAPMMQPECTFEGFTVETHGAGAMWIAGAVTWQPRGAARVMDPPTIPWVLNRNLALPPLQSGTCLGCGQPPFGTGGGVPESTFNRAGDGGIRGPRSCAITADGWDCGALPEGADGVDGLPGTGGSSVIFYMDLMQDGTRCPGVGSSWSQQNIYPGLPGSCGGAGGTAGGDGSSNFGILIDGIDDAEFSNVTLQRGAAGAGGDGADGQAGGHGAVYIDEDGDVVTNGDALPFAAGGPGGGGGGGHGGHGGSVYAVYRVGGSAVGACSQYLQSPDCGDGELRIKVTGRCEGDANRNGGSRGAGGAGGAGGRSQVEPTIFRAFSPSTLIPAPQFSGFDQEDAPSGSTGSAGEDGIDVVCQ